MQLPNSLRFLKIAVLVGDLIQLDTWKNKSPFHLRQVATEDDQVPLQWVCTQDIKVLDQRNKDIQLVQLSQTVHDMPLQADTKCAEVVKTTGAKEMENKVDEVEVEVDDLDVSKYKDTAEVTEKWQQKMILQFTKHYFNTTRHPDE